MGNANAIGTKKHNQLFYLTIVPVRKGCKETVTFTEISTARTICAYGSNWQPIGGRRDISWQRQSNGGCQSHKLLPDAQTKHLLRYWPIFARSSTLHFAGADNTRQNMTVHINNLVPSEFPNRSSRSAMSLISTLICI